MENLAARVLRDSNTRLFLLIYVTVDILCSRLAGYEGWQRTARFVFGDRGAGAFLNAQTVEQTAPRHCSVSYLPSTPERT
jgi:hypothetical protein